MSIGGKAQGLLLLKSVVEVPPFTVLENSWLMAHEGDHTAIEEFVREQGIKPPFAVRSSGSEEDGCDFSFAGMYETILPVSWDGLTAAAWRVWASDQSPRVEAYRSAAGLGPPTEHGVTVVIQELIDASVSGVGFSRAPWDDGAVAIEAVAGMGSALVEGHATPERHVLDRNGLKLLAYESGRQYLAIRADGRSERLNARSVHARRLPLARVEGLARHLLQIEQHWQTAPRGVDVEWCIDLHGTLYFLQCRPITSDAVVRGAT